MEVSESLNTQKVITLIGTPGMTITDNDIETYQTTVEDFVPQIQPDGCLPTAIKNIIDELAERKGHDGMSMSLSEINDLCNYKEGMYTEERIIPDVLSKELSDWGYQAVKASAPGIDYSELERLIEDETTSLPIVELDPEYFEQVDRHHAQGRLDEASHTVIVFAVNESKVLYYDPYEKFFEKSSRVEEAPYEWDRTGFYELWSGNWDERWTFWIERRDQSLLSQFDG